MFGVLNRFISKLDAAPLDEGQSATNGAYGFQILKNANQEVPLEPWFDFVIGINGRTIVSLSCVEELQRGRSAGGGCLLIDYDRIILIPRFSQRRLGTVLGLRSVWGCLVQR